MTLYKHFELGVEKANFEYDVMAKLSIMIHTKLQIFIFFPFFRFTNLLIIKLVADESSRTKKAVQLMNIL